MSDYCPHCHGFIGALQWNTRWVLDNRTRSLNGVRLEPFMFKVAELLIHANGEVVTIQTFVDALWPKHKPSEPNQTLRVHIAKLRRIFNQNQFKLSIRSNRKFGYNLVETS